MSPGVWIEKEKRKEVEIKKNAYEKMETLEAVAQYFAFWRKLVCRRGMARQENMNKNVPMCFFPPSAFWHSEERGNVKGKRDRSEGGTGDRTKTG